MSAPLKQRALDLAAQHPLLRSSHFLEAGIPRIILTRLARSGQLEQLGDGLYRLPNVGGTEHESLLAVALKLPQAVFCLLTALQFHELTTHIPRKVWIAKPKGSHVPKLAYPPLHMVQFTGAAFTEGIEVVYQDSVPLRMYSVAKTIADCFKHRNKIGIDVALEALKVSRSEDKASVDELWHFAKICRVANVMRPYMEMIE